MIEAVLLYVQMVLIFMIMVGFVLILRRKGLFRDDYRHVFERLVTEIALPIVIFSSLITGAFRIEWIYYSAILLAALIISAVIAYAGCRYMSLPRKQTGTIILVSSFGSTATIIIPFISTLYGVQSAALSEGLFEMLLGVAIPCSTFGVLIAAYFGSDDGSDRLLVTVKKFLVTPIFIAFALGLAISVIFSIFLPAAADIFTGLFNGFFSVIRQSLELLIWTSLALMLRPVKMKDLLTPLALVLLVKMIIQPALVIAGVYYGGLADLSQDILTIMAAAPSGAIAAVIADRYGCDGRLAASIVIATYLISLLTFPLVAFLVL